MTHRTSDRFWRCYLSLPGDVRDLADKNFELLKKRIQGILHCRFKKVGEMWSARVGQAHRALAVEDGDDFTWVWIGSHHDYEKMIRVH